MKLKEIEKEKKSNPTEHILVYSKGAGFKTSQGLMYGLYEMLNADGKFLPGKPFALCEDIINAPSVQEA